MSLPSLLRFICDHPLNRRRQAAALLDFASWQARARLTRGPVSYRWLNGTRVAVHRGDAGFTCNIYCGLHDFAEMGYLLHVLRPGDLFVDVGANVGSYTLLASAVRRARTICFEPVPETFARLRENLRLNQLDELVTAHHCGVGEKSGQVRFSLDQNCGNRVLRDDEPQEGVTVPLVTLDDVLADAAPSLMKIDVEGFELPVLRGAEAVLQRPELHSIMLEMIHMGDGYGYRDSDIMALLQRHSFASYHYDPFTRQLTAQPPTTYNGIFIRDLQRAQALVASAEPVRVKNVRL